ncbi:hypothetical protein [Mucilaginibacter polytrichastri]|nr:hypothetical protein [Mucilaginibacter polytrichastri]
MQHISQTSYAWYFIMIHDILYTQFYRMIDKERYEQMREELENLKVLGVDIASITCYEHKSYS